MPDDRIVRIDLLSSKSSSNAAVDESSLLKPSTLANKKADDGE